MGLEESDPRIEFFHSYESKRASYERAAVEAREAIEVRLLDRGIYLHSVTARSKDPLSLLQKLRNKKYLSPSTEVTDLVGVRVITYFDEDVVRAESVLRDHLRIDEVNSVAKYPASHREFGYRSVHLVASMTKSSISPSLPDVVDRQMFEVQIRSILQHSWAEIEHDIVYKSGTEYGRGAIRKFAAAAASLEMVEDVFQNLRWAWGEAVDVWCLRLSDGSDAWKSTLDAAGIIACLSNVLGLDPSKSVQEFHAGEQRIMQTSLVQEAGLTTPAALRLALQSDACRSALESFAADSGDLVSELSPLAVTALVVASLPDFPIFLFPDLVQMAHLRAAGVAPQE